MIDLPGQRRLANAPEFAALIGMSERWVQQQTRDGHIPCRRPSEGRVLYLIPDDLDAYLDRIADPGLAA